MTGWWTRHGNAQWRDRFRWLDQTPDPPLPLIGSSINATGYASWAAALADGMAKATGLAIVRTYSGNVIGGWSAGNVATVTNNYEAAVWHSFKTWNEAAILTWMNTKPDNGIPALLTYHHEPENDSLGAAGILTWQQRVSRLVELRDDTGRDDIACGPVLMRYTLTPGSGRNYWRDWYVGPPISGKTPSGYPGGYAEQDFIGWDAYNQGSPNYSTPSAIFAPMWAIADATGVPWAVGEWGSETEPTDPTDALRRAWLVDYVEAALGDGRCLALAYWNALVGEYDSRIFNSTAYEPLVPFFQASRDAHGLAYPKGT